MSEPSDYEKMTRYTLVLLGIMTVVIFFLSFKNACTLTLVAREVKVLMEDKEKARLEEIEKAKRPTAIGF